jgi:bifunctional non-homologous end joining protein LigD
MTQTLELKETTLYYREGSSDKIYQARIEAAPTGDRFHVRFAYGRRGSTLQTGTKTPEPVDYGTALRVYNQLVAAKQAKGYTPGEDGTPYQHTTEEGRSTGIYAQLLNPAPDEYTIGALVINSTYCVQEKYDGKRLMIRKRGDLVEGINRKGLIVAVPEPMAAEAMRLNDFLIDGEAVGDTLHVFDLLESGVVDYRQRPYQDRLQALLQLIPSGFTAILPVNTAWTAKEKIQLVERLRAENKEGVVLKNVTAVYTPGKAVGADQLKYKFVESASFVVTRVHSTKRSVSLGLYTDTAVVDAGNVTVPPNQPIPAVGAVIEVRYLYAFRQSGVIYQPVLVGERDDIEATECTIHQLKYRHEPAVKLRV